MGEVAGEVAIQLRALYLERHAEQTLACHIRSRGVHGEAQEGEDVLEPELPAVARLGRARLPVAFKPACGGVVALRACQRAFHRRGVGARRGGVGVVGIARAFAACQRAGKGGLVAFGRVLVAERGVGRAVAAIDAYPVFGKPVDAYLPGGVFGGVYRRAAFYLAGCRRLGGDLYEGIPAAGREVVRRTSAHGKRAG